MRGIIKAAGRTALRAAAEKAARSIASESSGAGRRQPRSPENTGGIRAGDPQSINDLGNTNGFGVIGPPNRPLTPQELLSEGFNPFNIPPGVSVVGAEVNECGGILTFQNHFMGGTYGTWSVGYKNSDCQKEPDRPVSPPIQGPQGEGLSSPEYEDFLTCGRNMRALLPGYSGVYMPVDREKMADEEWQRLNIPRTGVRIFRIPTLPELLDEDPFSEQAFRIHGQNRGIIDKDGQLIGNVESILYESWYGMARPTFSRLYVWRYDLPKPRTAEEITSDLERAFPEGELVLQDKETQLHFEAFYRHAEEPSLEVKRLRSFFTADSSDDCPLWPPSSPGKTKTNRINMEDCCEEILEKLDEQDEKISRLLDLLDPEGAWPITVPGQMIQLDNDKAPPLQLKSYPELWTTQLATQNRLREVAAPPGAWPIAFPKGIIEPMGEGELKIQSIGGMLTAILRGLDAKLGPIVNEVELQDGTPLEPGNQKVSLRFFGLSSLACQILQIAIDNEGDIDLSNNMLLRLAMTSAATQKAATQSALQTSEILDALGAKMNDKAEDVPFFFNPQAAAEVAEKLQNTEESTEALMAAILDTSTQKIKYLSVDEKRNIVMRLTQMEQAINTIQAGQAVEWDGSTSGLAALMGSYMLIDQIQDYKLKKELRNLDNQGDFGEWSKQHEEGYPEATATDEYSDTSKPWGRDRDNRPKIRKVDNNPDREQ